MKPPVSYQGGKTRIAKQIVNHLNYAGGSFYDLCCGCGAISIELISRGVKPTEITMVDCGPWGAVWTAVGNGTFNCKLLAVLTSTIPKDPAHIKEWVKTAWDIVLPTPELLPYWYLVFQSASFGGRPVWVESGKWKGAGWRDYWLPTPTSKRRSPVNPLMPMPDTLLERMKILCDKMYGVRGIHGRVEDVEIDPIALVYVDPPYEGLTGYGGNFDVVRFAQSLENKCWVSEARGLGSGERLLVAKGRAKGGVSGLRKTANEEWLSCL